MKIEMHKYKPGPYKLELHDAYRSPLARGLYKKGPLLHPQKKSFLGSVKARLKKPPYPEKEQREESLDEILGL